MTQLNTPPPQPAGGARLVLAALALAVLAVVLNSFYIARVRRGVELSSFNVYVLTRSVLPGDRVRKQDVRRVSLPLRFQEEMKDLGPVDDNGLETRLAGNEPVQRSVGAGEILRFMHFNAPEGRDIDRNITPDMRLVSLPVNSRTLTGALREGMFVDLEAAFHTGGALPTVMPVMERVKVVAVGTRTVYDEDPANARPVGSFRTITIEVRPDEATNLSMIERLAVGDFELQLRNPSDTRLVKLPAGGINPAVLALIEKRTSEPAAAKR